MGATTRPGFRLELARGPVSAMAGIPPIRTWRQWRLWVPDPPEFRAAFPLFVAMALSLLPFPTSLLFCAGPGAISDEESRRHAQAANQQQQTPRGGLFADIDRPGTPRNGNDGCLFQVPKH